MGHVSAVRWAAFRYHGEPESGEARTMDDGSVWARIVGPEPNGDDDRWVMLLDPSSNECAGVGDVRFDDMTVAVSVGDAMEVSDDAKMRLARAGFILDMYESGVYDREEAGEKLIDHLFGSVLGATGSED